VSNALKEGQAVVLFGGRKPGSLIAYQADHPDYIADSVDAFLNEIGSDFTNHTEPLHLGFTFRRAFTSSWSGAGLMSTAFRLNKLRLTLGNY
jgi:hypothetical protein